MKLTKVAVDKLETPIPTSAGTAQKRYYDDTLKGFGLRITSGGTKAFFVEKLINHKLRRITLGRYPEITVEQARREAQKLMGKIASGIDPIAEKQAAIACSITLEEAFESYIKTRQLKPRTLYEYRRLIDAVFTQWRKKPLISITKDMVSKHHQHVGIAHGQAYANLAMRMLSALFNFAGAQYEDAQGRSLIPDNPIRRLSQTRSWYRVEKRQTFIKPTQLPEWYEAVSKLENDILRDYLILLIFTGLRRQEAARLKWTDVDLKNKTLTVQNTKNHQAHTLPLSDFIHDLLKRRKENSESLYVFPGSGKGGYLVEPRKQMRKVTEQSHVTFTVHDLRRTFITIAESLDISAYSVKRLVNHKMTNDVTSGYIITDIERLRAPMQKITDYLLKAAKIKETLITAINSGSQLFKAK